MEQQAAVVRIIRGDRTETTREVHEGSTSKGGAPVVLKGNVVHWNIKEKVAGVVAVRDELQPVQELTASVVEDLELRG